MIRLSVETDKEGLTALWKEAFGDSEEAIGFFLENRYIPENTVVSEDEGKINSMLFLLDGRLSVKGKLYESYYLYAAATLKESRGRGIMKKMLDFAKNLSSERKIDFICLKPAEKGLFDYYASNGYKTVFTSKTAIISSDISDKIDIVSSNEYDRFVWDNDAIDFAVKQHEFYGGKAILAREGYCLYIINDGVCCVKDFFFTDNFLPDILNEIRLSENPNRFEFDLPFNFEIKSVECSVKDNGMALAITERANSIISEIDNAYLNLTLD